MLKNFNNPLVSIIINCHNGEKFLKKSISSVIKQTYKNWEIVLLDNKSTDKSKQIFNLYKDKRLKYFKSQKFLKLYEARNLALKKSKGKYICFLDTDDWWDNKKLEKQINFFKKNSKINCIYSNFYNYNDRTKKKKLFFKTLLPEGMITQQLLNNYCIGILTVMLKKKIFKDNQFDPRYNIIGDFDFFLRISLRFKIGCLQEPLAYYRAHGSNYSLTKHSEYIDEINLWIKKAKKYKIFDNYSLIKIKILKNKLMLKKIFSSFIKIFNKN